MRKAQSIMEFTILMIIIVAAFLTMQVYIKRGIQGRWKQAVDDIAEQYDSNGYQSSTRQTLCSVSSSAVFIRENYVLSNGTIANITYRVDQTDSQEQKTGQTDIAPSSL